MRWGLQSKAFLILAQGEKIIPLLTNQKLLIGGVHSESKDEHHVTTTCICVTIVIGHCCHHCIQSYTLNHSAPIVIKMLLDNHLMPGCVQHIIAILMLESVIVCKAIVTLFTCPCPCKSTVYSRCRPSSLALHSIQ